GYYVWAPLASPCVVHISLDVIDRLQVEIIRGYGLLRRRNEEVGGILIGRMIEGSRPLVQITDFELVPCDHRYGLVYSLRDEERTLFEGCIQKCASNAGAGQRAVGYFRGHIRDGMSLSAEDVALMDSYFPNANHVALLVKPSGSQIILGGFYARDNGVF